MRGWGPQATKNINACYSSIFGEMSREIRAFGMLWTATQNLTDLPDQVRNQFAIQFCFNTASEDDMRALRAINRDLAKCASRLKKYEFADAKMPRVHDEIPMYRANVSILSERQLPEREKAEVKLQGTSKKRIAMQLPPSEDRPTATMHAALVAVQYGKDTSLEGMVRVIYQVLCFVECIGGRSLRVVVLRVFHFLGVLDDDYVIQNNRTEQKIVDVIRNMTTKDAKRIGLSKRHLFRLKKRIKSGGKIKLNVKTLTKLINI